jgi:DNA invertase Pin-like site-specific DNA recombinase
LHPHPHRDSLRLPPETVPDEPASIPDFIRPGNVLIIVKLDRLGRNTRDVLNLVHELEEKGASLRVLEPGIDTGGPMGRMVLTVLGMVAEMELGFIRDRQRAGIDAAKAKGVYKGRPVTFDRARIVALRKEGMGATEIAKAVGCKRGNVYKALKAAGLN